MILNIHKDNLNVLSRAMCEKYQILLLCDEQNTPYIGYINQTPPPGLNEVIKRHFPSLPNMQKINPKLFYQYAKFLTLQEEIKNHIHHIGALLDCIILAAIKHQASDIHIEHFGQDGWIRFRIHGELESCAMLNESVYKALCSKIKLESRLDITQIKESQDGRAQKIIDDKIYDLRISVLPLFEGESIVIRILSKHKKHLMLEDLHLDPKNLDIIKNNIHKTHGIILITGPTGSGKSTTQYAMLESLKNRNLKIITIEDPIEYQMPFATQIQTNEQLGFSQALRAILRQDPDVIMVGEIRDAQTLELAFSAALTGHLVLATLHANDISSSFERLLNLGLSAHNIFASLLLIISQRLLKPLCPKCKKQQNGSWYAEGCEYCNMQGSFGRELVYEICEINQEARSLAKQKGFESLPRCQSLYENAKSKNCFSQDELNKLL